MYAENNVSLFVLARLFLQCQRHHLCVMFVCVVKKTILSNSRQMKDLNTTLWHM